MLNESQTHQVELHGAQFDWNLSGGSLRFFGLPAVLFWLNPSLLRLLQPLVDEVGVPLYRLLVASQSSLGTDEDYQAMITQLGDSFETGFLAWGRAVSTAGWGWFELPDFDAQNATATVVVRNPWELIMQQGASDRWGCPFLQGKIIGIFSHAFGANCWADEEIVVENEEQIVRFRVYASNATIDAELAQLRDNRKQEAEREIERKTRELLKADEERALLQEQVIRMQAAALTELSTPLIPLTRQIVLMPLIGAVDSQRAQRVIETLLQGVAEHQASIVILDITGVAIVDTSVANALIQAARAVRLLGAEVVLTGIRPEIAQTLIGLGADLSGIVTRGTLQSGVTYAMAQE